MVPTLEAQPPQGNFWQPARLASGVLRPGDAARRTLPRPTFRLSAALPRPCRPSACGPTSPSQSATASDGPGFCPVPSRWRPRLSHSPPYTLRRLRGRLSSRVHFSSCLPAAAPSPEGGSQRGSAHVRHGWSCSFGTWPSVPTLSSPFAPIWGNSRPGSGSPVSFDVVPSLRPTPIWHTSRAPRLPLRGAKNPSPIPTHVSRTPFSPRGFHHRLPTPLQHLVRVDALCTATPYFSPDWFPR